ncbi:MAG: YraN family protein [Firmicutes bacterium]|nr:YraN family protein [Bacillota bacterium]
MTRRQQVGKAGEEAARSYLESKGYRIAEANFRCPYGEIDLVTFDREDLLVFVEVRTRTGLSFGTPAESITAGKLKRIQKSALYYMKGRFQEEVACRFDLIAVQMDRKSLSPLDIRHYLSILD